MNDDTHDDVAPAAATTSQAAPTEASAVSTATHIPGDTISEKIDALHAEHFLGTELANHTTLWNKVIAFREAIKKLIANVEADLKAL